LHCVHCHCAVTLTFSDWHDAAEERIAYPDGRAAAWTCPHCRRKNEGRFPGILATVVPSDPSLPNSS